MKRPILSRSCAPGTCARMWRRTRMAGARRSTSGQRGTPAQALGNDAMTGPATCEVIGRWRSVTADLRDRGYLDMVEPAYLQIGRDE